MLLDDTQAWRAAQAHRRRAGAGDQRGGATAKIFGAGGKGGAPK